MSELGQVFHLRAWSYRDMRGASSATFSPDGAYRYDLRRTWDPAARPLVAIGLNPSTADAFKEDNTIRRFIGFASSWGCGGLVMLNAFALRSTDPRALYTADDAVGPENDRTLERVLRNHRSCRLVLAWGHHGALDDRGKAVADLALRVHGKPECFGRTANGHPKHPLYLAAKTLTQPYLGDS